MSAAILFLEENDKSEPIANRHYKVLILVIWYSIKKAGRNEYFQLKGIGYITDEDLIIAYMSKTNKPYL